MIRLALKLAFSAAALWAVWTFVPVHGRTLADRWHAAGSFGQFVERGLAEVSGRDAPARPQARKPGAPPTEGHTAADRAAVDRLVSERLSRKR